MLAGGCVGGVVVSGSLSVCAWWCGVVCTVCLWACGACVVCGVCAVSVHFSVEIPTCSTPSKRNVHFPQEVHHFCSSMLAFSNVFAIHTTNKC